MVRLPKPKKLKKKTRSQLKKEADKLFSLLVRRIGRCEMCLKTSQTLQCAHIVTRSNLHLRYDPKNALCLCYHCHLQVMHRDPLWAMEWFRIMFPKRHKYLMKEREVIEPHFDYDKTLDRLRDLLANR